MQLTFTQGIVRFQKDLAGNQPKFIQVNPDNDGFIDLVVTPDPTIVVFAHKDKNYIIEETQSVEKAWGPMSAHGQTQYLYWDINYSNGSLTRKFTIVPPTVGPVAPTSPVNDQHWFDPTQKLMFVWLNGKWQEKIRVFAGVYDQNAVLGKRPIGSQAGLINLTINAGNIMLGTGGHPLRDTDGSFLTTETEMVVTRTSSENVKFDTVANYCAATESIPKFYLISFVGQKQVALASYLRADRQVNGIVREHLYPGEVGNIISSGKIKNELWTWDVADIGKPLFCGPSGQVTLNVPPTGVCQQIGTILDTDEISLWIMSPVIL
jgi:hypothetical protein